MNLKNTITLFERNNHVFKRKTEDKIKKPNQTIRVIINDKYILLFCFSFFSFVGVSVTIIKVFVTKTLF